VNPVNLYSDTQTTPSDGMRDAMARAAVGDEQRGLDPTTSELQERVAKLLGHEAAVFMPSGTMCNEIALRLHIRPGGDAVFLHRTAHPLQAEAGGPAQLAGATAVALDGDGGMFTAADLERAAGGPPSRYSPRPRLVCVEQTTNLGGGRVWPVASVDAVLAVARGLSLRSHLDGARLMNASVAAAVPPSRWAEGFDTAWLDFSKGLGAPVGAVLAGSRELVEEAWRWKQMLGGAMRQSGILAAACIYALENNVERLADDHANALLLAERLAAIEGIAVDPGAVETNIVIFAVEDAQGLVDAVADDVTLTTVDDRHVRAVTHLDVDRGEVLAAADAIAGALAAL